MENKINLINAGAPIIQVVDLKTEFLAIKAKFIGQPLTKDLMERMNQEIFLLFERFDLKDLQYSLVNNREAGSVQFKPHREIDRLAIKGILGEIQE